MLARNIKIGSLVTLIISVLFLTSCTYTTPETENPNPGLESLSTIGIVQDGTLSIRKSFFGVEINQETNRVKNVRKTWLCGWAPVNQSGKYKNYGGLTATPYKSRHCNLEFHISKDGTSLEGREVNVDYANVVDWQLVLTIPIKSHYFYEKDVDSRGRELNKYKKVTDRKNWQLSPMMDLDIKNIQIHDLAKRPGIWGGSTLTSVSDVELEGKENANFFGFSGTQVSNWYGSLIQHEMRFNFLEFKGTPGFKKTPYHQSAAKHMNILHILGGKPDGLHEVNYAAHWDVQKPVEVCLNGFPEDSRNYKQIGHDVIDEMNKAMEKIGAVKKGQKAFVVSSKQPKYHYDLRCPSITWVNDPALSLRAPLGIGLVNADVRTGEILWGGAVIWGGLIDYIVNRDSESVSDAMTRNTHEMLSSIEGAKNNPYYQDIQNQLPLKKWSPGFKTLKDMNNFSMLSKPAELKTMLNEMISDRQKHLTSGISDEEKAKTESLIQSLSAIKSNGTMDQMINGGFSDGKDDLLGSFDYKFTNEDNYLNEIKRISQLSQTAAFSETEREFKQLAESSISDSVDITKLVKDFAENRGTLHDAGNLVENHYYTWQQATAKLSSLEKLAAAKSVIKNVTLHEWGHVVGLGHQFEGNRLPEKGSVPDSVYNYLAQEAKTMHNYSSIMDYQSGHTEVSLPYEKVKMQAQDELVLSYLYKQQYSTYSVGDKDFTFYNVPASGEIPTQFKDDGKEVVTTYLPQCSDMDAWLGTSPYCRRWDRGYDAPTIVNESFKEYTDSFISRMNSFTEATGGNPFWANYRLWSSTYNLMNYNRTYYDQMRYMLSNNDLYDSIFDKVKTDESALLSFSKACINPVEAPKGWEVNFTKLAIQPTAEEAGSLTLKGKQDAAGAFNQKNGISYGNLYSKYASLVKDVNVRNLDEGGYRSLEEKMNSEGLEFTELQKLCRASKKSLDVAKVLLSLKGPDRPLMNYDDAISPTGLRGGNATTDYSRLFGRYDQLGLLPIKIAALDVLTNTSSTMQYGWWRIGKPKFNDPNKGKFGYFSMYPEEFTDVIGTAVKNNMGFGGTVLQDSASMSISNLYMSYFLFRTFFMSNDGKVNGFKSNYIDELKNQTKFNVNVFPVLLESVTKPSEPKNKVFGFNPKIFNLAKRQLIDLPEAYVLPDRRAIIRGNDSQIIMPITKVRFLGQGAAYVWALEVTYDNASYDDQLEGFTVKNSISTLTNQELDKCMGGNSGLSSFFNSDEFEGFLVDPSIALDKEAQNNFEKSVDIAFDKYHGRDGLKPSQIGCEESEKGIGLISATALSLNGWIIPQVFDYIKK